MTRQPAPPNWGVLRSFGAQALGEPTLIHEEGTHPERATHELCLVLGVQIWVEEEGAVTVAIVHLLRNHHCTT